MSRELKAKDYEAKGELKTSAALMFWCNDAFGCRQKKDVFAFSVQRKQKKVEPDLCDQCCKGMIATFGINPIDLNMLVLIRHQENTLCDIAKNTVKGRDLSGPFAILKAGEVERFRKYLGKISEASAQAGAVQKIIAVRTAYATWWWNQLEVDYSPVGFGIKTFDGASVPVGDR